MGRKSSIEIRGMELFEFNQQIKKGRGEQEVTIRRSYQSEGQSDNRGAPDGDKASEWINDQGVSFTHDSRKYRLWGT